MGVGRRGRGGPGKPARTMRRRVTAYRGREGLPEEALPCRAAECGGRTGRRARRGRPDSSSARLMSRPSADRRPRRWARCGADRRESTVFAINQRRGPCRRARDELWTAPVARVATGLTSRGGRGGQEELTWRFPMPWSSPTGRAHGPTRGRTSRGTPARKIAMHVASYARAAPRIVEAQSGAERRRAQAKKIRFIIERSGSRCLAGPPPPARVRKPAPARTGGPADLRGRDRTAYANRRDFDSSPSCHGRGAPSSKGAKSAP